MKRTRIYLYIYLVVYPKSICFILLKIIEFINAYVTWIKHFWILLHKTIRETLIEKEK
jgi:hypothetical protein